MNKLINSILLIIIIGLFIILLVSFFKKETFVINVKVDKSKALPFDTNGLFAEKDFKRNDIIEVCPVLQINKKLKSKKLSEYYFKAKKPDADYRLLSLGYCGLINHSDNNYNASWKLSDDDKTITFYCIKDINKGEEILTNYGDKYWNSRTDKI